MKHLFTLLFISLFGVSILFGQDIDLFSKNKNDNFNMPSIDKEMSFEQFQLLSRDLRMQDMMYAIVVPGWTHFKAQENTLGYSMVGARVLGYSGLAYVSLNNDDFISWGSLLKLNLDRSVFPEEERTKYQTITSVSTALIIGSYLFDWIHGQYRLSKKQEQIRYKYSLKLSSSVINMHGNYSPGGYAVPSIGLCLSF
ncbi:MAG: hypothetical protein U9N85_08610 [Bacteroidota bacterium]|nr:hypothetical protein [Bacteroidota bacterium]